VVTLRAVATARAAPIDGGTVKAEGDLDFRGTLGVAQRLELTERHSVVYQTLVKLPPVTVTRHTARGIPRCSN
jgi:hypothetical protein